MSSTPAPRLWTGGLVVLAIGIVATLGGLAVPVIGGPVLGILLGLVVRRLAGSRPGWAPVIRFTSQTVLQAAVVLLGATLSLGEVWRTGLSSLPVLLGTLVVCLLAGSLLGRRLGIDPDIRTLITCGTAICGASAIATISAVIGAKRAAVAYSVTVIFVFNILAALTFPLVGHLLALSPQSFGLWAGTAINDTSSVVAAGTTYGAAAASYAVIVKLTRTVMIVPVAIGQAVLRQRGAIRPTRLVPPFLVLFLVAAGLGTIGVVPHAVTGELKSAALLCTTLAMGAIGLATPLQEIRRAGIRPLALGGSLWVLVAVSSLVLQKVSGLL
ncbi:putative sulfate exporter family transporter [Arsenicicoccus piscis]|uniref:YeiH family protein n=1 Tax=Arsenicicoccus piscis TaxID=673954 RepID=UPI001F4D08CD|nr:putative sulfate exporter family transporter [Arsenicicoccus piscis]MCH8628862.1 putative sulfate exporter family transporter [Arsenicicoccus piscis]